MRTINFTPKAATDYIGLDPAVRLEVRKAIAKLESDPVSYGDPLGNKAGINLYGFYSIRAGRRIRVIYFVDDAKDVVVLVIGKRDRFIVHQTARERARSFHEAAGEELKSLQEVFKASGDK